jgi:hypothetical protein
VVGVHVAEHVTGVLPKLWYDSALLVAGGQLNSIPARAPPCLSLPQILGVSVDSQFSHLAWIQTGELPARPSAAVCPHNQPCRRLYGSQRSDVCTNPSHRLPGLPADRKEGGVGDLKYPLVSDLKREIRCRPAWRPPACLGGLALRWRSPA